jgi:glutamyl/glutaminyl-tRNA synthetase
LAPTPSGYLHTGNIYNFLLNWLWARSNGGKVLLRIDDGDAARKRAAYVEDIFKVLHWLQLDWDIGPASPDDFEKNWSQQHRSAMYRTALELLQQQQVLFACNCSRTRLATTVCDCAKKQLPFTTEAIAWRIKVIADSNINFTDKAMGSVTFDVAQLANENILQRKDGTAAYQLTSVIDDAYFGVTHICRGSDLLPSTAMQLYVDKLLPAPHLQHCSFWHHQLLVGDDGTKFSKSAGHLSTSIIETIKKETLLASFANWMGWPQNITLKEMIGMSIFSL